MLERADAIGGGKQVSTHLDPELKDALCGEMTPKFLATLDSAGRPNCVPVITITPYDDETLIFGEFFMNKSRKNLLENDNVGVAVIQMAPNNGVFEAWSLKGTFLGFETVGERIDAINQMPLLRYNAYTGVRAAGAIRVVEVSERHCLTKGRFLRDFLWASALAPLLKPNREGRRCMPGRVVEKFRRMSAVRAAAFRDADGFPRAFGVMACVPAGPNRLVMGDPLLAAYEPGLEEGAELAVSVLTMDPIAYQVKGEYRGRRAGLSVVDLMACYSASPPLLGERLDV